MRTRWHHQMPCFVRSTVQNLKISRLLSCQTRKSSRSSHWRSWNHQMFPKRRIKQQNSSNNKTVRDCVWVKFLFYRFYFHSILISYIRTFLHLSVRISILVLLNTCTSPVGINNILSWSIYSVIIAVLWYLTIFAVCCTSGKPRIAALKRSSARFTCQSVFTGLREGGCKCGEAFVAPEGAARSDTRPYVMSLESASAGGEDSTCENEKHLEVRSHREAHSSSLFEKSPTDLSVVHCG